MADLNLAYLDKEGMSWSHWVVQHWTATILGYVFICNAFTFYYFEKNRWLRRASAVPDADETRGEAVRDYLAAVLVLSCHISKKDAEELTASSPLGSMKDVEEASQSSFEAAFGVKMGGLLHQRIQSDVERRNRHVPRDLSSVYAALLYATAGCVAVEAVCKRWVRSEQSATVIPILIILRAFLLAGQAACSMLG